MTAKEDKNDHSRLSPGKVQWKSVRGRQADAEADVVCTCRELAEINFENLQRDIATVWRQKGSWLL